MVGEKLWSQQMDLKPKITLKKKGDSADIPVKNLIATLSWTAAVDLDLYAFYRAKMAIKSKGGFLGFGGVKPGQEGKSFYGSRGKLNKFPWMQLDQDSGVGDQGGTNEENLRIVNLDEIDHILIVANIFNKPNADFSSYDGKVTIKTDSDRRFEIPLTATTGGNWCVVARIDNTNPTNTRLINVNKVQSEEPTISQFS